MYGDTEDDRGLETCHSTIEEPAIWTLPTDVQSHSSMMTHFERFEVLRNWETLGTPWTSTGFNRLFNRSSLRQIGLAFLGDSAGVTDKADGLNRQ